MTKTFCEHFTNYPLGVYCRLSSSSMSCRLSWVEFTRICSFLNSSMFFLASVCLNPRSFWLRLRQQFDENYCLKIFRCPKKINIIVFWRLEFYLMAYSKVSVKRLPSLRIRIRQLWFLCRL